MSLDRGSTNMNANPWQAPEFDSFEQWTAQLEEHWVEPLRRRIGLLLWRKQLHDAMREAFDASEISPSDLFWEEFHHMYLDSQLIGIRRLVDSDRRTLSLGRLLGQLENQARKLTRTAFVDRHVRLAGADGADHAEDWSVWEPSHRQRADESFDQFTNGTKTGFASAAGADRKELVTATEPICTHVNQLVAHDEPGAKPPPVTYDTVDIALKTMDTLVCKYSMLIADISIETTLPFRQEDPLAGLRRMHQSRYDL